MKTIIICFLFLSTTGCAGPLLLGLKSYQSGETRLDFITGADFTVGANGVDSVNNNRGIRPRNQ